MTKWLQIYLDRLHYMLTSSRLPIHLFVNYLLSSYSISGAIFDAQFTVTHKSLECVTIPTVKQINTSPKQEDMIGVSSPSVSSLLHCPGGGLYLAAWLTILSSTVLVVMASTKYLERQALVKTLHGPKSALLYICVKLVSSDPYLIGNRIIETCTFRVRMDLKHCTIQPLLGCIPYSTVPFLCLDTLILTIVYSEVQVCVRGAIAMLYSLSVQWALPSRFV